jgi:hypothetical protein
MPLIKLGIHLMRPARGAPETEALLMIDAQAVDMGSDGNCYSVYLQNIKLSGKWIGEEVVVSLELLKMFFGRVR